MDSSDFTGNNISLKYSGLLSTPQETGYTFKPIVINLANMQVMFDNEEFRSIPI